MHLPSQVWQILAITAISKIGLNMRDDPLCRINCHAAVVIEFSGLSRLNRDSGIGIMRGKMRFVTNQLCLLMTCA